MNSIKNFAYEITQLKTEGESLQLHKGEKITDSLEIAKIFAHYILNNVERIEK